MEEMIDSMIIDDKKEYSLFTITKNKITKSDHCTIFVELNIQVPREIKGDRFNVWNITSDGSSKFKELTKIIKVSNQCGKMQFQLNPHTINGSSKLTVYYTNVLRKGE